MVSFLDLFRVTAVFWQELKTSVAKLVPADLVDCRLFQWTALALISAGVAGPCIDLIEKMQDKTWRDKL